jgi:hypothetical protein
VNAGRSLDDLGEVDGGQALFDRDPLHAHLRRAEERIDRQNPAPRAFGGPAFTAATALPVAIVVLIARCCVTRSGSPPCWG